jgi:hypothetical protein
MFLMNFRERRRYELRLNGLPRAPVNRGWSHRCTCIVWFSRSTGADRQLQMVRLRTKETRKQQARMGLTPILRPAPGQPKRKVAPRSCVRKFVAFVKYVTRWSTPGAARARARSPCGRLARGAAPLWSKSSQHLNTYRDPSTCGAAGRRSHPRGSDGRFMHVTASELRRIPLLRTWVNKPAAAER